MAKSDSFPIGDVERIIEEQHLAAIYNSKASDFPLDCIVKCSYRKGLHRVVGTTMVNDIQVLVLSPIECAKNYDISYASPKFLQKVKVNESAVQVLFND